MKNTSSNNISINKIKTNKRCSKCILPESIGSIEFNNDDICNYCTKYEKDFSNWDSIAERKKEEFESMIAKAKKLKRSYDCLIPLSGGKDSTYALYLCSKIYKLKCIAVTFDNGFLSNPAKLNISNALKATDADHIFYHINRVNSLKLYKSFLVKTGEFCKACMRGINYSIEAVVKMFDVPLVIKGSGRRVEYISQIAETAGLHTPTYFHNVIKGESFEKEYYQFISNKYSPGFQKVIGAICDILKFPRNKIMRFFPQYIGLYDYIYLPYNKIIDILKKEMGWKDVEGSVEHLDCELHGIPFWIQTLKIPGITTETFRNSHLIRQGIISREQALKEENDILSNSLPPSELKSFLSEINMQYDEFEDYVKKGNAQIYEPKTQKKMREIYHNIRKW